MSSDKGKKVDFTIEFAKESDKQDILKFIRDLAEYEKLLDRVKLTEEMIEEHIFKQKAAEVIFANVNGVNVGYSIFFHNFSTFVGPGLYIEDLFVKPEYRGHGVGMGLVKFLANLAKERKCQRMEWVCLNWNKPSIDFYTKKLGAEILSEWSTFRLSEDGINKLCLEA